MKRTWLRSWGAGFLAAVLSLTLVTPVLAEDAGTPSPPPPPPPVVQEVIVRPGEKTLEVEEKDTLTALIDPSEVTETPTWSIEEGKSGIVSITPSSNGKICEVTGLAPGEAKVLAKVGDKTGEAKITVRGVRLEKREVDLFVYQEETLRFDPFGIGSSDAEWTSSNTAVVDVINGKLIAYSPGTATVTVKVGSYQDRCQVTVKEDVAEAIQQELNGGETCKFSELLSALNSRSVKKTGSELDYVTNLSVSPRQGILFHGYVSPESQGHGVGGMEHYVYRPDVWELALEDVTFVPRPGFSGTAVISYTGCGTNGVTFNGTIRVEIQSVEDVNYTTAQGRAVLFSKEDFQNACRLRTGRSVQTVQFDQPSPSKGALYYDYGTTSDYSQKVSSGTSYFYAGVPSLDRISFVPARDFSGTVTIPYRCTDTSGGQYSGKVAVTVQKVSVEGKGDVEYTIRQGKTLDLDEEDFNRLCAKLNGERLRSIRFDELPAASQGKFFYRYETTSEARVTSGTDYYYRSTPRLELITFAAAEGFAGEVQVPFTGKDVTGAQFSGTLRITVKPLESEVTKERIFYETDRDGEVFFDGEDFNRVCRAVTGSSLDRVRFTLPPSREGSLHYREKKGSGERKVSSTQNFYRSGSSQLLDRVLFRAGETGGEVYIDYTGWSVNNEEFAGTVRIKTGVRKPDGDGTIRYAGCSQPIVLRRGDLDAAVRRVTGYGMQSVRLTVLPAASAGHVYLTHPNGKETRVTSGVTYYAEGYGELVFVPKAGYQGKVILPFEGSDSQGNGMQGTIEITLSDSYCGSSFADMSRSDWAWARPSVEFLRSIGVTNGYSDGTFRPGRSISRGEFVLMLCRAYGFESHNDPGFPDVPKNSVYASAVAAARELGIVQGSGGRFHPDQPITRQSAMTMLCRAMRTAGQNVPETQTALLNGYRDGGQVSGYARSSVAALVRLGVVRGTASMELKPGAAISRAEMAVILHRALTI